MIKKRIPQLPDLNRTAKAGDFVHGWDGDAQKSVRIDVSQLPAGQGGGGGGGTTPVVSVPSPFFVKTTYPNYHYDAVTNSVKISDTRLLHKSQYPVSTTQYGGEFELDKLTYNEVDPDDDTMGSVVIGDFQLDEKAHITITVPGATDASGDSQYKSLIAAVALHELVLAPLMPTALGASLAKLWWPASAGDIPPGYQECIEMRGVIPIAHDPDDAFDATTNPDGLNRPVGTKGGEKMHTNSLIEMVPHDHEIEIPSRDLANFSDSGPDLTHDPGATNDKRTFITKKSGGADDGSGTGNKVPVPYSIMNPYLIGMWIEFVGVQ